MILSLLRTVGGITVLFSFLIASPLGAQEDSASLQWLSLPLIQQLSNVKDPIYHQQQELLELYYQSVAQKKPRPELSLFRYKIKEEDTVFTLAGSFNIPYETLSTLNGWGTATAISVGQTILVPTQTGLFVDTDHPDAMDQLMAAWRIDADPIKLKIPSPNGIRSLSFIPGERFHPIERAFFLGILFRFPLPKGYLTSPFGIRSNPFTGHPTFHAGIDIGAPYGTDVYAAKDGVVTYVGYDRIYGNHIKVDHDGDYQTIYGHLSKIEVSLKQSVVSGTIIGKVGSTGMSTGPHLHFEIRRKGHPEDPVPLLPSNKLK